MPDNTKPLTGYPSVDKPWLKYYSEEAINAPLPSCKYSELLISASKGRLANVALEYMGRKITYGQLFDNARYTAAGLANLGVKAGDIVTVFSVNTPETIYVVLAMNLIGAVPCLEYATESGNEAIAAIKQCNSRVVVILDALLERFSGVAEVVDHVISLPLARSLPWQKRLAYHMKSKAVHCAKEITYSKMIAQGRSSNFTETAYRKGTPAVIVHSGGTTGAPKGVVLSDDNISYIAWAFLNNGNDTRPKDRWYTAIPLFHAFGFCMGIVVPLALGQAMSLSVKYDEKTFVKDFRRIKPNHTMSSSTYLTALIADPQVQKMKLSFYKTMGMGGTPLTHAAENALCDYMEQHGSIARASLGYGMSEVASAVCTELNRYYGKVGSVGIPLCKVNIKAVDTDTGQELPYGQEGELYLSSPGTMLSYFANEKETNAVIDTDEIGERWIKTGDLGYVDEDGFVFITGKLKRIYTARASENGAIFHVFPDYIADTICNVSQVRECAVVCLPHPVLKSVPVAFVVADNVHPNDAIREAADYCSAKLPEHSRPKAFFAVGSIPKTTIGKPDYKELEQMAKEKYHA